MFPRFGRGAFGLFAAVSAVTLLLGDRPWSERLAFDPGTFARGDDLWTPLSAGFLVPEPGLYGLALTLVAQWLFGSALEGRWGTRRYVALVLGCSVGGHALTGLCALALPGAALAPVSGPGPIDVAAASAFAIVFAREPVHLAGQQPIPGRVVAAFFVSLVIAWPLVSDGLTAWPKLVPALVSAVAAVLLAAGPWRRGAKSGTMPGRKLRSDPRHLRVVRRADDLLN